MEKMVVFQVVIVAGVAEELSGEVEIMMNWGRKDSNLD